MNNSEEKTNPANAENFPSISLAEWQDTKDTLHLWTQIVGKIQLVQTPLVNHFWNVALYVSARGLTTSAMPFKNGVFEIEFDFIDHHLIIKTSAGATRRIRLEPKTVAQFYEEVFAELRSLDIEPKINQTPDEIPGAIPFTEDTIHKSYVPEHANRFWRILFQVNKIFNDFRAEFVGKVSPVHFFWGSFDLAVTRFNGKLAPERKDADAITREAYSHEVISHGLWFGGGETEAAFYAYAAPEPDGLKTAPIKPQKAFYNTDLNEFFLMYEDVRQTAAPEENLSEFLHSTYNASANLAKWNRPALERNFETPMPEK